MPETNALDEIARGLAGGMSRRDALRRGGAAFAAAVSLSPADAWAKATGRCPKHRVACDGRCCPSGQVCIHPKRRKGQKRAPKPHCGCPAHTTHCHGKCVHTQTDPHNCGHCGHHCATGEHCSRGVCTCPQGRTKCGSACRELASDPNNCGACGHACGAGEVCSAGHCLTSCPSGTVNCNGGCVALGSDPNNCGACGHVCAAGMVCSSGACVSNCPSGTTNCSGACVTTGDDPANCGACGTVCTGGLACYQGACTTCPSGTVNCGGRCVNTASDSANCGACGHACAPGQYCSGGACTGCPSGDVVCGGGCCQGTGCCGKSCQTVHSNGLGGNYYDCGTVGTPGNGATYSKTMAQEAAASYTTSRPSATTCAGTSQVLIAQSPNGTGYATWAYSGPLAGRVLVAASPTCPNSSSPSWN